MGQSSLKLLDPNGSDSSQSTHTATLLREDGAEKGVRSVSK